MMWGLGRVCLRCQASFIATPWKPGAAYCCGPAAGEPIAEVTE